MRRNSFSVFLLFSDDLKIFRFIKSTEDCKLLKSEVDCLQKWCVEIYMKINIFKTNLILLLVKLTVSILTTFWVINYSYEMTVQRLWS
jgi:hypothetical protein